MFKLDTEGGITTGRNRIKTVRAGRLVYAVCYSQAMGGEPQQERAAKNKVSSAARQRLNFKQAWQKLELLIAANFDRRDLFVTLTYDDGHLPADREGATKAMRAFLARMRSQRRRRGEELKYIYNVEEMPDAPEGVRRLHHHLILNAVGEDAETLRSLWACGQIHIEPLLDGPMDAYEARARYMVKERQPGEFGRKTGLRAYTPSRNLQRPETTSELVPDSVTIAAPPGAYVLDRHAESNTYGQYAYIKYLLPEARPRAVRRRL